MEQFTIALPSVMENCTDNKKELLSNPYLKTFVVGGLVSMIIEWVKNSADKL